MIYKIVRELKQKKPDYTSLKDCLSRKKALIIGCGPSLNQYSPENIEKNHEEYVFFVIKQAFSKFEKRTNFHFLNDNNLMRYRYNEDQFVVGSSGQLDFPFSFVSGRVPDLHIRVKNVPFNDSICIKNDFINNELSPDFTVKWGPGIMLESVIPFVVLTGIKHIRFIGWDYSSSNDVQMEHFYENTKIQKFFNPSKGCVSSHQESLKLVENSSFLFDYLQQKNIHAEVLGDGSFVSEKFERVFL